MKTKLTRTVLVYLTGLVLSSAVASAQNIFIGFTAGGVGNVVEVTASGKTNIFYLSIYSPPGAALAYPEGMVFNSAGDLFVTDTKFGKIYEFTNDNGTLRSNLTFFASMPGANGGLATGMAFDRAGDLFVSCDLFGPPEPNGVIAEYTNYNGTLSPNATIFAGGLFNPIGLAFDRSGNLFVSNGGSNNIVGYITEITLNGTQSTFYNGLSGGGGGLAFDGMGNLYAGQMSGKFIVLTTNGIVTTNYPYANHFSRANWVVFDNGGDLFGDTGNVEEYTPQGNDTLFFSALEVSVAPFAIDVYAFQPTPLLQCAAINGAFQLTVTMPSPYYATVVQSSPDLVNWSNVYSNTPPFTFTDSLAESSSFYRVVLDTNYY